VIEQIGRRLEESDASARPAVVMLAFDEAQQILNLGGGLPAVRWFGGDSVALSPAVLRDETAAQTAAAVRLTAVAFGIQNTPKFREVQGALEQAFQTAVVPDAVFAYDVPWMLATALEELEDPQDVAQLRERLPELAPQYIGATGWMKLDDNGDRQYSLYDVWQVQEGEDGPEWRFLAEYRRNPGLPGYIVYEHEIPEEDLPAEEDGLEEELPLTREEFAFLLVYAFNLGGGDGTVPFSDMDTGASEEDDPFGEAVAIAYANGIVAGYADGTFRPGQPITRAETAVMLQRALIRLTGETASPAAPPIADREDIPAWALKAVEDLTGKGVIPLRDDGRFAPRDTVTLPEAMEWMSSALFYS